MEPYLTIKAVFSLPQCTGIKFGPYQQDVKLERERERERESESERDGRSKKVALPGFHEKTQIAHQDLKFRVFILWVNNYYLMALVTHELQLQFLFHTWELLPFVFSSVYGIFFQIGRAHV